MSPCARYIRITPLRNCPLNRHRLREPTKKRDLKFYKIQAPTKGIPPVVRITDKLVQAKSLNAEECQDLKKFGLEAMSLLTHASYEINMQQCLLLRPDIGKEYSALCSSQLPFTDFLFGDDLQKHLKDIGDQNKIGAKITFNYKGQRPSPGRPGNNSYKQSKNWRGHNSKPWKYKTNANRNKTTRT